MNPRGGLTLKLGVGIRTGSETNTSLRETPDYGQYKLLAKLEGMHAINISAVAVLPNGEIISGDRHGVIVRWENKSGKYIPQAMPPIDHCTGVNSLTALPDGSFMADVWIAERGTERKTQQYIFRHLDTGLFEPIPLPNLLGAASNVQLSPDRTQIAYVDQTSNELRIYSPNMGESRNMTGVSKPQEVPYIRQSTEWSFEYSAEGDLILTSMVSHNELKIQIVPHGVYNVTETYTVQLEALGHLPRFTGNKDYVFIADSWYLYVVSRAEKKVLWCIDTRFINNNAQGEKWHQVSDLFSLPKADEFITSSDFSPENYLWHQTTTGTWERMLIPLHNDQITRVERVGEKHDQVASIDRDGSIVRWITTKGNKWQLTPVFPAHEGSPLVIPGKEQILLIPQNNPDMVKLLGRKKGYG